MKPILTTLLAFFLLSLCAPNLFAVVAVNHSKDQKTIDKKIVSDTYNKLSSRSKKKLEKRLQKFEKKLNKKRSKKKAAAIDSSIFDDGKFRLGAVVFLAGLAFSILSLLFFGFAGLIAGVASLAMLIGLVLMIWALLENA